MFQISRSQLMLYALAGVVIVVLGVRYLQREGDAGAPNGAPATVARAQPTGVRVEPPARGVALVHVAGAVRRPGVYRLKDGARIEDAVSRAGGARPKADLGAINLAAKVNDGQQIVVPTRGTVAVSGAPSPGGDTAAMTPGAPVNLNTATAEQLDTLDGIGPATARKILDWRQRNGGFRSVDDLTQVPGIGPKRMAALHGRVQV